MEYKCSPICKRSRNHNEQAVIPLIIYQSEPFPKLLTQRSIGNVPQAQIDGQAQFAGFLVHTFKTSDKVLRYGVSNRIDFSGQPTVVQRGDERTINVYAAISNVA